MPKDATDAAAIQDALAAALKAYAEHVSERGPIAPYRVDHNVTQTQTVIVASALLEAANIELFELALWQTFAHD